jgi:CheY-like chemotaxis protein
MPKMDGIETSRLISKQCPRDRRPRIVAMTANAMEEDRQACFEAGMDDYLSKPVRLTQLQRALEKCTPLPTASQVAAAKKTKRRRKAQGR